MSSNIITVLLLTSHTSYTIYNKYLERLKDNKTFILKRTKPFIKFKFKNMTNNLNFN